MRTKRNLQSIGPQTYMVTVGASGLRKIVCGVHGTRLRGTCTRARTTGSGTWRWATASALPCSGALSWIGFGWIIGDVLFNTDGFAITGIAPSRKLYLDKAVRKLRVLASLPPLRRLVSVTLVDRLCDGVEKQDLFLVLG